MDKSHLAQANNIRTYSSKRSYVPNFRSSVTGLPTFAQTENDIFDKLIVKVREEEEKRANSSPVTFEKLSKQNKHSVLKNRNLNKQIEKFSGIYRVPLKNQFPRKTVSGKENKLSTRLFVSDTESEDSSRSLILFNRSVDSSGDELKPRSKSNEKEQRKILTPKIFKSIRPSTSVSSKSNVNKTNLNVKDNIQEEECLPAKNTSTKKEPISDYIERSSDLFISQNEIGAKVSNVPIGKKLSFSCKNVNSNEHDRTKEHFTQNLFAIADTSNVDLNESNNLIDDSLTIKLLGAFKPESVSTPKPELKDNGVREVLNSQELSSHVLHNRKVPTSNEERTRRLKISHNEPVKTKGVGFDESSFLYQLGQMKLVDVVETDSNDKLDSSPNEKVENLNSNWDFNNENITASESNGRTQESTELTNVQHIQNVDISANVNSDDYTEISKSWTKNREYGKNCSENSKYHVVGDDTVGSQHDGNEKFYSKANDTDTSIFENYNWNTKINEVSEEELFIADHSCNTNILISESEDEHHAVGDDTVSSQHDSNEKLYSKVDDANTSIFENYNWNTKINEVVSDEELFIADHSCNRNSSISESENNSTNNDSILSVAVSQEDTCTDSIEEEKQLKCHESVNMSCSSRFPENTSALNDISVNSSMQNDQFLGWRNETSLLTSMANKQILRKIVEGKNAEICAKETKDNYNAVILNNVTDRKKKYLPTLFEEESDAEESSHAKSVETFEQASIIYSQHASISSTYNMKCSLRKEESDTEEFLHTGDTEPSEQFSMTHSQCSSISSLWDKKCTKRMSIHLLHGKNWRRSYIWLKNIKDNVINLENIDDSNKGRCWKKHVEDLVNSQPQEFHVKEVENCSIHTFGCQINESVTLFDYKTADISENYGRKARFSLCLNVKPTEDSRRVSTSESEYSDVDDISHKSIIDEVQNPKCEKFKLDAGDYSCLYNSISEWNLQDNYYAKKIVLRYCEQTEPLSITKCFDSKTLVNCTKIGEGVYGEVFMLKRHKNHSSVLKIIPIEGKEIINGEKQKTFSEIASELIISSELSNLKRRTDYYTECFADVQKFWCVYGKYPKKLIEIWHHYDEKKGSDNDSPEVFKDSQMYLILELSHGGEDLESFVLNNAQQALSVFYQVANALAVAEEAFMFEHRDLHWGNILVSKCAQKETQFTIHNVTQTVKLHGVKVTIIDYTLSRISINNCTIFNNLGLDPELFTANGDFQFEVYRLMKIAVKDIWEQYVPKTNVIWLFYLLGKMTGNLCYRRCNSKVHKAHFKKLERLREYALGYSSVNDLLRNIHLNCS